VVSRRGSSTNRRTLTATKRALSIDNTEDDLQRAVCYLIKELEQKKNNNNNNKTDDATVLHKWQLKSVERLNNIFYYCVLANLVYCMCAPIDVFIQTY